VHRQTIKYKTDVPNALGLSRIEACSKPFTAQKLVNHNSGGGLGCTTPRRTCTFAPSGAPSDSLACFVCPCRAVCG